MNPKRMSIAMAAAAALAWTIADRRASTAEPDRKPLKAIVHINFADTARHASGLRNIENILKAEPDARIEVVCHGAGIDVLVKEKSTVADKVDALARRGVVFFACENTMREKSLTKDLLLKSCSTVPSGAVEVLRKQQEGWGYFRP